jgi:hypothetical protein
LQKSGLRPNGKSTWRSLPCPTNANALACHISAQTRTQRPQSVQLSLWNG